MDGWVHMTYVTTQKILEWLSQLKDVRSNSIRQTVLVWLRSVGRSKARGQKLCKDITIYRAAYKTKQMKKMLILSLQLSKSKN